MTPYAAGNARRLVGPVPMADGSSGSAATRRPKTQKWRLPLAFLYDRAQAGVAVSPVSMTLALGVEKWQAAESEPKPDEIKPELKRQEPGAFLEGTMIFSRFSWGSRSEQSPRSRACRLGKMFTLRVGAAFHRCQRRGT